MNAKETAVYDSRSFGKNWHCFETFKKGSSHTLDRAHEDKGEIGRSDDAAPFIDQAPKLGLFSYRG
jgi:hypothetical protein